MTGLLGLRPHVTVLIVLLPLPAGTEPGAHRALHSLMGPSRPDGGVCCGVALGWAHLCLGLREMPSVEGNGSLGGPLRLPE